jgi:dTDP-4-dehydrorhamnose 3,5-epimerase
MQITKTSLPDVLIIEPRVFPDGRGFFFETYQRKRYNEFGITSDFVQDNLSHSVKNTLRGLHYQLPHSQAKLVQVLSGEALDIAVDIRVGSPTFGQWLSVLLSAVNKKQLYVPRGFAHGFCVLSESVLFSYKCDDYYAPECEKGVLWSDPDIGIEWPVTEPLLSNKDSNYNLLKNIPEAHLPIYKS